MYMHVCLYVYMYMSVYVCVHCYIYIFVYIYIHTIYLCLYIHMYIYIYIYIYLQLFTYIYIYVFVFVYIKSVLSWVFTDKRWNMGKAKVFWVNICCTLFSHISLITPPTCPCFITVSSRTGLDLRTCSKWSCTKHAWTRYGDHVTRCDMVKALKHLAKRYETLNSLMAKHCKKWQDVAKQCQIPCRSVKLHFTWTNI